MTRFDWDWNFGAEEDPEYRRKVVRSKLLDPLGIAFDTKTVIGAVPESPVDADRQAEQTRKRLEAHDRIFGLDGGLVGSLERVSRPRYGVGDPEGDRDVG